MNPWRALRRAGTAIWIGGELYGVAVLPSAGDALMRRRDRHRALVAAWHHWTPLAFGALAATAAGTLLDRDTPRRGQRLASLGLAIASTVAGTILGELLARDLKREHVTLERNELGMPVAHLEHRRALQLGMIPVNVAHAAAAAGLVLADG